MVINSNAVKSVIETISKDPKLSEASVHKAVILDIINAQVEQKSSTSDNPDEHEFGNPAAFTTGLISGNFPSW